MEVGSSVTRLVDKSRARISNVTAAPAQTKTEDIYDDGYLRIEHQSYYLSCGNQPLYLPRIEFLLISRLSQSIERVVSFADLWQAAWGDTKPLNCGALRVHIYRLRNKLLPYRVRIDALVNVGYRLITTSEQI